ncbi:hypothetical protein H6G06_00220 [Anabaena sphaerica FACHB-251]|uniref:Uncharacterized protein n=1 Tax=Anabaena sphaerica FACHB-251 TaxID=2692883 RepID=A0A926WEF9_9NOST|nr:hypothetical protein [Anabaena sphaerica FACHB-251]
MSKAQQSIGAWRRYFVERGFGSLDFFIRIIQTGLGMVWGIGPGTVWGMGAGTVSGTGSGNGGGMVGSGGGSGLGRGLGPGVGICGSGMEIAEG